METDYLYQTISKGDLERRAPLYRQIYERLRSAMESGELASGAKIPTNAELSRKFKAGVCTVQSALAALERDGFVERRQGVGTFVKGAAPRLSSVAIYFDDDFWHLGGMDYYRVLCGELQLLLDSENIAHRLFIDRQTGGPRAHFPKNLLTAARNREIQAVIAPLISNVTEEALKELAVPVVRHSGRPGKSGSFNFSIDQLLSLSLGHFASLGCRSAGYITCMAAEDGSEFLSAFERNAAEFSLAAPPQSRCSPVKTLNAWELERYGYDCFKTLLAKDALPDGLLIYPDTVAKGVVMGVLESQAQVPEKLKLVFHENEGIPFFHPFPAASVVSSPVEVAKLMLRHARGVVAGEAPDFASVSFKFKA
jgi:hypothetical protein